MKVHYYEIHGCDFEYIDKEPAIIAPEGADEELLKKYDFVQLLDGRWCHYMDMDEKLHMMNHESDEILIFNEGNRANITAPAERDSPIANIMLIIAGVTLGVGLVLGFKLALPSLVMVGIIVPLVLVTLVRFLFPGSEVGRTAFRVMLIHIIICLILLAIVSAIIDSCERDMKNREKECWDNCQGIGEMGSQFIKLI